MLRKAICMTGPEAAELFYDTSRFMRRGATPGRIQKTLFGQGGVQSLDGDAHRRRKQLFMWLMAAERIGQLGHTARQCAACLVIVERRHQLAFGPIRYTHVSARAPR